MNLDETLDQRVRNAYDDIHDLSQYSLRVTHRRDRASSRHMIVVPIAAVCAWSLLETRWELSPSDGSMLMLALAVAKLILLCSGVAAILDVPNARPLFVFLCGASLMAVASALPFEYTASRELFGLSLIECLLKAAVVGLYAFRRPQRR
ncbi:hypothetical protein [Paraburkholderia fynbosensis]|nr:hypothetical protein [Paraburkholderia fynbosensis]